MNFSPTSSTGASPALRWDVFCRVIDNHGDLGVCWRLSADLAQRGHTVRLWVDDASALSWMAPQGCAGVEVRAWPTPTVLQALTQDNGFEVADVVVEAFGCELPDAFQALLVRHTPPVWINLEYLSAERFVERNHGLPSPVMRGPAKGLVKWFFYPGFTPATGGLLREVELAPRQAAFDRKSWLRTQPWAAPLAENALRVSLFCYEPHALPACLQQLAHMPSRVHLLVTPGRPEAALRQTTQALRMPAHGAGQLQISTLPYVCQTDFDLLLWSCDLNFVRGEDSLVRALWAGQPFVWQLYPQDDLAHHHKLHAFADALDMPTDLRQFHAVWNGLTTDALPALSRTVLDDWQSWVRQARQRLLAQSDLSSQLVSFVIQKR